MFIPQNYSLAVILCIVTMLCWGSWGNTQKLAGKAWRFELFYWDYAIGIFVLGSNLLFNYLIMKRPFEGEPLSWKDYAKGSAGVHLTGVLGGVIWNIGTVSY